MTNPFKPDDKVLTLRKGIEIEATVRTTWNHEVQVRTAEGDLLWRTVKTIRSVTTQAADTPENPESHTEITGSEPPECVQGSPTPVEPDTVEPGNVEPGEVEPGEEEPDTVKPAPSETIIQLSDHAAEPERPQSAKEATKLKKRRKGILSKFIGSDFDS